MSNCFPSFFTELTPEQQKILIEIRRRKTELLLEIQVSGVFLLFFKRELLISNK